VKKVLAMILASAMLVLCAVSLGCDPRGYLTDKEAQSLYEEIEALIRSGDIWESAEWPWVIDELKTDDEAQACIELLKAAAKRAFAEDTEKTISGIWFSSKKYCRTVDIKWRGSILPDDERKGVQMMFSATKYRDGHIVFSLSDIVPSSSVWRKIAEASFD
jgi:hypothetical protein